MSNIRDAGYQRVIGNATVNESLVVLRPSRQDRNAIVIQNLGAGVLYIGTADLTTSNGLKLDAGDSISLDAGTNDAIYATSVGSCDVRYMEESL